jgi:hypothetical protein
MESGIRRTMISQQTIFLKSRNLSSYIMECGSSEKFELLLEKFQLILRRTFFRNICCNIFMKKLGNIRGKEIFLQLLRQCTGGPPFEMLQELLYWADLTDIQGPVFNALLKGMRSAVLAPLPTFRKLSLHLNWSDNLNVFGTFKKEVQRSVQKSWWSKNIFLKYWSL